MLTMFADVVDRADIGMIERGRGLCFAAKTFQCLTILSKILWQELERDEAAQTGVLGLVDDTHSAAAELCKDAIVRDGLAYHSDPIPGGGAMLRPLGAGSQSLNDWLEVIFSRALSVAGVHIPSLCVLTPSDVCASTFCARKINISAMQTQPRGGQQMNSEFQACRPRVPDPSIVSHPA
jgi:hypothetical protein